MKHRAILGIVLAAMLQTAALAGMVARHQRIIDTGTEIVLNTRPVDPRSLFRGDYVALNYEISTLAAAIVEQPEELRSKDTLWVVLEPGETYWRAVAGHRAKPALAPGQVALRGEVRWGNRDRVMLRYGIESFFVPEGEGRAIERPGSDQHISVRVAIDADGNAAIKAILLNGTPRYEAKLL